MTPEKIAMGILKNKMEAKDQMKENAKTEAKVDR